MVLRKMKQQKQFFQENLHQFSTFITFSLLVKEKEKKKMKNGKVLVIPLIKMMELNPWLQELKQMKLFQFQLLKKISEDKLSEENQQIMKFLKDLSQNLKP